MGSTLSRFGLGIPFVLGAMFLAFGFGTYFGGKYLVPPGQGLAAPAEAMGYGLLAALVAIALAILGSVKLPMALLRLSAILGAIIIVLAVAGLSFAITKNNADMEAHLEELREQQNRPVTAPAVEPPCPLPEGDTTTYGHPPCQDE